MNRPITTVAATAALLAATTALTVTAATAGPPNERAATATAVTCGQTLTTSVRLANDLAGCSGTGLVIGAAGITVDLNGHTISGVNAPKSDGIADNGRANVKILNGTIKSFRLHGVAITRAKGALVSRLTVSRIGAGGKEGEAASGVLLDHSPGSTVRQTTVTNHVHAYQSDGVDVLFSSGTQILQSRLSENAWDGLVVIGSPRSRVVGNALDSNGNNGLEATAGSNLVLISGNHANRNRSWGMAVGALRGARVLGNTVSSDGHDGFLLFDLAASTLQRNRVAGNAIGINLSGGQHGSKQNQLLDNQTLHNKQAGISVVGENAKSAVADTLIARNTANSNGREGGIVVDGAARRSRLRGNTANANAGHGISVVTGTIDAGGNRARANRKSPQCVRLACG